MAEPVQEHRAFDSSFWLPSLTLPFFFSRVLFDNEMLSRLRVALESSDHDHVHTLLWLPNARCTQTSVDVVVSVSDLPAATNLVLKLRMFFAWSGDRTIVCSFDCAIKRANRFKAVTRRHACAPLFSVCFPDGWRKSNKVVCLQLKGTLHCFFFFLISSERS